MNLLDYRDKHGLATLARQCNCTEAHLDKIALGHKNASYALARLIRKHADARIPLDSLMRAVELREGQ